MVETLFGGYARRTVVVTPGGETVIVSTIENALARETAVFPGNGAGQLTKAEVRFRQAHGPDAGLDEQHVSIVALVSSGALDVSKLYVPTTADILENLAFMALMTLIEDDEEEEDESAYDAFPISFREEIQ